LPPGEGNKYTVPAIQHIPSNKFLMDSAIISDFVELTYPDPPVPLKSELGSEVESKARRVSGMTLQMSLMPREINILSPRAQEFFRRTREATLGNPLEDLLDLDKEEQSWNAMDEGMRAVGELMRTNKAEGPFILGAKPSYTDFFIAGSMQCSRVIEEGVFQRIVKYPGFVDVYEACLPYMEKRD
jgi:glutathione S-transferase